VIGGKEDGAMSSAGAQAEEVRPAIGVADSMDCRCRVRGMGVETLSFCSVVGKIQMGCGVEVTLRCRTAVYLSMRRAGLRTEGLWSTLMYNLPTKRVRTPQRPHRGDSQNVN
jgi:hypothetical protein